MKNGTVWQDTEGHPIQAHGGMILQHEGVWYWYGENKSGASHQTAAGKWRVDVVGISCYSSTDLQNWKNEGIVLKANREDPENPLYYKKVCERPKVLFCKKTGKFVMLMHLDHADYTYAAVGIAVADCPTGPFKMVTVKQPNKLDVRDMTVWQEPDGTAWLIHSTHWNRTLALSRLTEDYTDVDGFYVYATPDQKREAPALCYHNGTYYMITSGCTGWKPNSALYATSPYLTGPWLLIDNPCEGPHYRKTFNGQSTYIFEHNGQKYLMLDHWKPEDLSNSGYSFLPLDIDDDGTLTVRWTEEVHF